jgi:hypothetical protein
MRAALALMAALLACAGAALGGEPSVDERLVRLRSERTVLQVRADDAERVALLTPLRTAGLLTDALSLRLTADNRPVEQLPAPRRQALAALVALNEALGEALANPGEGTRTLARETAERAGKALEALASDDQPLVLQVAPRVVPPRRGEAELVLVAREPPTLADDAALHLKFAAARGGESTATVVRYVPDIGVTSEADPAVEIEIVGLRLAGDAPPTLTVGAWRGEARMAPERLHFSVPRSAFAGDAARAGFASGLLALRRDGRLVTFELPFLVLPDQPGSVALDEKVRHIVPESNTLMSPEIMVRAGAGETRSLRRCFDPPAGWRFDKKQRRVVIVERLGWLDDVADDTLNGGTVEFAGDEGADQVCLVVSAKPVTRGARTATIGRFEATLSRDEAEEKTVQSGVRALDWHEPLRLPIEPGAVERRLYVRLLGAVRQLGDPLPASLPFLRIGREDNALVLQVDPSIEP